MLILLTIALLINRAYKANMGKSNIYLPICLRPVEI